MAEEDVESGCARRDGSGEWETGPENGRGPLLLQEMADKALEENLSVVIECILVNIRAKHLPSLKTLFDLAARVRLYGRVPEEEYRSLAEVLWKAYLSELEAGAEIRDQGSEIRFLGSGDGELG
jgi:hypothetical protein